ncbi:MAG: helix-turn-helix transcriptional regulator [Pseudonocardiaceae bacterium]
MRDNSLMPRLGSGIPLVGRHAELGQLRAALARAARGEACGVVVSGDAGVGKTRLITELAERAESEGALVLSGRCQDMAEGGLPYLPFADALAPLAGSADAALAAAVRARPALGRLLPQVVATPPVPGRAPVAVEYETQYRGLGGQDLGQLQLFEAVLGLLTELARRHTVALVVEDVHWADSSTRDLLSFLLARLRGQRMLVVASYRQEDVHRRHPLRPLLAQLARVPSVERLELHPFAVDDARAFVDALAEDPLDPDLVTSIVERSEGNAFFAEELLASCAECDDGMPAVLADVLLARLERLSATTQRVVRIISVADGAVAHAALAELSGLDELALDEVLREAVQHHVLVIEDTYYTFRHALVREAVYGDLLPSERTRLHAAFAARLAGKTGRGRAALLAHHSLESNDLAAALAASLPAAEEAEELGAPASALRHIEQALGIWDAVPDAQRPDGVDELMLLQEASYFAGTSGEPERAIAFARSAADLLDKRPACADVDVERAARVWRRLAEALIAMDGTEHEAPAAIDRAWALVADAEPSTVRAWVLATRAAILRGICRVDDARGSALAAVADARVVGALGAEADALITLATLAEQQGDMTEARDRLREARAKAAQAGALQVELRARYYLGLSYDDQAQLTDALQVYRQGTERAAEVGLPWSAYGLELSARTLYLEYVSGQWPLGDVPSRGQGAPSVPAARMAAAGAYLLVGRGEFDRAEAVVNDLRAQWRTDVQIAMTAGAVGAELSQWRGDHTGALRRVRETIGWLDDFEPWLLVGIRLAALGVAAAASQAALSRQRSDADGEVAAIKEGEWLLRYARECVERGRPRSGVLGPEGRAWLARAEAEGSRLPGQADSALWAEAVLAFGYGAVYDQAVCRWRHAEALLGQPDVDLFVADELAEAHAVAEMLGAIPLRDAVRDLARRARVALPGHRNSRDTRDPLTARERAVLEQVALGRTNRQVGTELYISEKTVSVHLSRVMAKLGATRRAEAVAIAYDRGLLAVTSEAGAEP